VDNFELSKFDGNLLQTLSYYKIIFSLLLETWLRSSKKKIKSTQFFPDSKFSVNRPIFRRHLTISLISVIKVSELFLTTGHLAYGHQIW